MYSDSSFFNVFGFGGPKIKRIRIRRDIDISQFLDFSASNIWIVNRKNGSMCHLHFKTAFEKIGPFVFTLSLSLVKVEHNGFSFLWFDTNIIIGM